MVVMHHFQTDNEADGGESHQDDEDEEDEGPDAPGPAMKVAFAWWRLLEGVVAEIRELLASWAVDFFFRDVVIEEARVLAMREDAGDEILRIEDEGDAFGRPCGYLWWCYAG